MKNTIIHQYEQRLDRLFKQVGESSNNGSIDIEMVSHMSRYLCILVSGYLETSVRLILVEYCRNKSSRIVSSYAEKQIARFQSPKSENIISMLRSFDDNWATNIEKNMQGEIKDSIDSLVNIRHNIAHGNSVGITYHNILQYYKNSVRFVAMLEQECAP